MKMLRNVNNSDIKGAIELGCTTMQSVFNADDNDVPFFTSVVYPKAYMSFFNEHSESHVPGRHLNALLEAQDKLGIKIDESAIEKHRRALLFSYSGPIPLPLNRETVDGELVNFFAHNIREGFHGLYALVKYRGDSVADELAKRSVRFILENWDLDSGWKRKYIQSFGLNIIECPTFIIGLARALGPILKYYKFSGYMPAFKLASKIKQKLVDEFFVQSGEYDSEILGRHCHSITCVLSSLAQLAEHTNDASLMERVKAFYDNGLWQLRDEIGWCMERFGQDDPDRGEANCTGDIVETALILARWGYEGYYDDAELIMRAHLLPSQLRDNSFVAESDNPDDIDGLRNVAERNLGAFGFPAPYGHKSISDATKTIDFNMDIVGGVVSSLCQVNCDITSLRDGGLYVNLLFDYQDENVKITGPYSSNGMTITMFKPFPAFIRLPVWVDKENIQVSQDDWGILKGKWLYISKPKLGKTIKISYPLTQRIVTLRNHIHPVRVQLRGDEVMSMEAFTAGFRYFADF